MKLVPFEETLHQELRDPEFAVAYLQDALDESEEEFLVALRAYVQANGGIANAAREASLAREAVYRMLSETGNPEWRSINRLLKALGLHFRIEAGVQEQSTAMAAG